MNEENAAISRAQIELDRLLTWVRAAESRLALVIPISTAMLGALAVLVPVAGTWTIAGGILAAFATVLLILSVAFAACASFPRTSGPKGSLIYFGGIASRELDEFLKTVKSDDQQAYLDDLHTQCHRNAQIAERKYTWVQRSIACLFLSVFPWSLSLFLLYLGRL